ncbi:hypothetical protein A9Q86_00410 [Flavobacteriales bacterium 33_180_T64]|nr:hypothetical protein A9Q86_00410 [Flavobacteriales bacterium 33_180_T64]
MRNVLLLSLILILLGCQKEISKGQSKTIKTEGYELIISDKQKGLLILFPGGGGNSENIKKEFKIVEKAKQHGISLVMINFSRKLWIEDEDCKNLSIQIKNIIKTHRLSTDNIYLGGMSIGGNVTLTLSQYLLKNKLLEIKGAFVIDPPLDLFGLYESSIKDLKREDFSEEQLTEPKWIVQFFEDNFSKDTLFNNIQKVSPFTSRTKYFDNISELKNIKLRFYTEPDIEWWKDVRNTEFESSNAFYIRKLNETLRTEKWNKSEFIETQNRGYRSNGERNPHSWSIVDRSKLIEWILKP